MVLPSVSWIESAETHIARHQVAPHEVEEVLYGRPRYLAPGRSDTRLVFACHRRQAGICWSSSPTQQMVEWSS